MNKTTPVSNAHIEALKLAEEALLGSGYYDTFQQRKALAAIREALAEPVNRDGMVYYKNNACKAKDANSPNCICWTKAESVKQEPVAWMNKVANVFAQHPEGARNFGCDIALYAAPVDAKAIRAEALEEAAKVCETDELCCKCGDECAAAIRGLK